jgi:hypothetical protein
VQYGFAGQQQYSSPPAVQQTPGPWGDGRSALSPQPMGLSPQQQQYGQGVFHSNSAAYNTPAMQAGAAVGQPGAYQQPGGNVLAEYQADLSHLMPGVGLTVRVRQPAAAAAAGITAQQIPSPRNYTPVAPGDASAPLAAGYQHLHENPLFGEDPVGGLGAGPYTPSGGDSYGQYNELQYRPTR